MDVDIFGNRLSPKYRILSAEEVSALLDKFKATTRDLPKIKLTDPAAKQLGATEGAVMEIIRNSKTAGEAKYYRFVVK